MYSITNLIQNQYSYYKHRNICTIKVIRQIIQINNLTDSLNMIHTNIYLSMVTKTISKIIYQDNLRILIVSFETNDK